MKKLGEGNQWGNIIEVILLISEGNIIVATYLFHNGAIFEGHF